MSRPSRSAAEVEKIRREMINAGARALAQGGYGAWTMQAIADEAGCSVPTLYKYFDSKSNLLVAMFEMVMADMMQSLDEPALGDTLFERLHDFFRRQYQMVITHHQAIRAITGLNGEVCQHAFGEKQVDPGRAFTQGFTEWFERTSTRAERGGLSARELAYLAFGIGDSVFMRWVHDDMAWDLPEQAERVTTWIIRAIGAGK